MPHYPRWGDVVPTLQALLVGQTVEKIDGMERGSDEIVLHLKDGAVVKFWHDQDCCESVYVEDVIGRQDDLIGSPLTMADEVSSEAPDSYSVEYEYESTTWTFYKFATVKGYVTVRWFGTSNGYYSEDVSFAYFNGGVQ